MIRLWLLIILFQVENYRYKLNLGFGLLIGFLVVYPGAKVLKFSIVPLSGKMFNTILRFLKSASFPFLVTKLFKFFLSYMLDITGAKSWAYLATTVIGMTNVC